LTLMVLAIPRSRWMTRLRTVVLTRTSKSRIRKSGFRGTKLGRVPRETVPIT
jgi:hypothetical protein